MRCDALSTDDQPGNLLSWDELMQTASINFLQTLSLIITGESRHWLKIFGSKFSFKVWITFFLNIEMGYEETTQNNSRGSLNRKHIDSSWLVHQRAQPLCGIWEPGSLPHCRIVMLAAIYGSHSRPHPQTLQVSQGNGIPYYIWKWNDDGTR